MTGPDEVGGRIAGAVRRLNRRQTYIVSTGHRDAPVEIDLVLASADAEDTTLHRVYAVLLCGTIHFMPVPLAAALAKIGFKSYKSDSAAGDVLCRLMSDLFRHPEKTARRLRGHRIGVDSDELYPFLHQLEASQASPGRAMPKELQETFAQAFDQAEAIKWRIQGGGTPGQ